MIRAEIRNQYGRLLGDGVALTREEALMKAHIAANETLMHSNANWKWRKEKIKVSAWGGDTSSATERSS